MNARLFSFSFIELNAPCQCMAGLPPPSKGCCRCLVESSSASASHTTTTTTTRTTHSLRVGAHAMSKTQQQRQQQRQQRLLLAGLGQTITLKHTNTVFVSVLRVETPQHAHWIRWMWLRGVVWSIHRKRWHFYCSFTFWLYHTPPANTTTTTTTTTTIAIAIAYQ